MAIQALRGASSNDVPSQKWASAVNRFVYEYAQMKNSTGPARIKGHGLGGSASKNKPVAATNPAAQRSVKMATAATESLPLGRCRIAVRGFAASRWRSARR